MDWLWTLWWTVEIDYECHDELTVWIDYELHDEL